MSKLVIPLTPPSDARVYRAGAALRDRWAGGMSIERAFAAACAGWRCIRRQDPPPTSQYDRLYRKELRPATCPARLLRSMRCTTLDFHRRTARGSSSGIIQSPDYTMEQVTALLARLGSYIHPRPFLTHHPSLMQRAAMPPTALHQHQPPTVESPSALGRGKQRVAIDRSIRPAWPHIGESRASSQASKPRSLSLNAALRTTRLGQRAVVCACQHRAADTGADATDTAPFRHQRVVAWRVLAAAVYLLGLSQFHPRRRVLCCWFSRLPTASTGSADHDAYGFTHDEIK